MSLQIICFKLEKDQLKAIDDLVLKKLYFSRSEVLRFAIRHYLAKLAQEKNFQPGFSNWSYKEYDENSKESVSTKFPPKILEFMDQVVQQIGYPSRSHFLRDSIDLYLQDRYNLHNSL